MEDVNLLQRLERVKAPDDFEQNVLSQLSLKKNEHLKIKPLRLALAGAFSALVIAFVVVNIFLLPQTETREYSGLEGDMSPNFQRFAQERSGSIPILENVDYRGEVNTLTRESSTIYILEQVSDSTDTNIKY